VLFQTTHVREYLLPTLMKLGSPSFRGFLVRLLPSKNIRQLCDIVDVMHNTSIEILESKRRALEEGNEGVGKQTGGGKDIISILSMCIWILVINYRQWSLTTTVSESKHGSIRKGQNVRLRSISTGTFASRTYASFADTHSTVSL
jgi:hypothetical protein